VHTIKHYLGVRLRKTVLFSVIKIRRIANAVRERVQVIQTKLRIGFEWTHQCLTDLPRLPTILHHILLEHVAEREDGEEEDTNWTYHNFIVL
jgi:hypothetical protein